MPEDLTIADLLQAQARAYPQTMALIVPSKSGKGADRASSADQTRDQTLTFAELERTVCQTVAQLQQAGLRSGEAALVFQPMSIELYVLLLALFRMGAIAMFVDPSAGRDHLEQCCALYPPKALIATAKAHWLRVRSPALGAIPLKWAVQSGGKGWLPIPGAMSWRLPSPDFPVLPCRSPAPTAPALLTFTSGSTGQPKAALRTHAFLLAQHRSLSGSLGLTAGEIDLSTLPIFVLANLASGVTSLIPRVDLRSPGKIDAASLMAQIQRYSPHSTAASPALLERLADYCEANAIQSSFQRLFSGGAPVLPKLLERLQRLAPQAEVSAVYGSTEAEPIAHIAYRQFQAADVTAMQKGAGLLVGKPVAEIQLRVVVNQWGQAIDPLTTAAFAAREQAPHAAGEIVVSGDHVLSGYLNGQGDRETKFRVEGQVWHRTGDLGYLDASGRLWLLGRCSAAIADEQGVLYPFAVEVAASFVAGIRRTAIVSQSGKRLLVVELAARQTTGQQGSQQGACLRALREALAWATIQDYRIVAEIPVDRRHNAKVNYPALLKLLSLKS